MIILFILSLLKGNNDGKIKNDAIKAIIEISKKYPLDVINNNNISNDYLYILPSNKAYLSGKKEKVYLYTL